jgi:hypothetical protein
MSRTNKKWIRVYADGVDISGYIRDAGKLGEVGTTILDATLTDGVKNGLLSQTTIQAGPINAVLDNDGSVYPAGMFSTLQPGGTAHVVSVAIGTLAAPTIGDPCFNCSMNETQFQVLDNNKGFITIHAAISSATTGGWTAYEDAFGYILHPKGTETAVNSANQIIDMGGYISSLGGMFTYHLFTSLGSGTVTLKMQQSASGTGGWSDVTGATSPALTTPNATGLAGVIALPAGTSVDRYLRWQLVFSGCTSATFYAAFVRQT